MPLAEAITDRLEQLYGCPQWTSSGRPLDVLVQTILSQHTSDSNSARAFADLTRHFPGWSAVQSAPADEVTGAIRSGGLPRLKAQRIQAVLRSLGNNGLDDLQRLPREEARRRLTALPGVGPKTAACVLLFACGMPALPVDTHVHRVATRLGLLPCGTSAEAAHPLLEAQLDPGNVHSFHVNMVRHGRTICRARNPRCSACGLRDLCAWARGDAGRDDG